MRIGGVELSAEDVTWLQQEGQQPGVTRSALARKVCERKRLVDGLGRSRVATARIDLCRLARTGRLSLPLPATACFAPPRRRPVVREEAIGPATLPASSLAELGQLTVFLVRGASDPWHPTWNRVLDEHHYLGAGPLCGAQLRYVVCARDQVVAAASFSSAALSAVTLCRPIVLALPQPHSVTMRLRRSHSPSCSRAGSRPHAERPEHVRNRHGRPMPEGGRPWRHRQDLPNPVT